MFKNKSLLNFTLILTFWLVIPPAFCDDNHEALTQAAFFYQQQDWQKAATSYEDILNSQPKNQLAWFRLSTSLIELQKGKQAIKTLNKTVEGSQIPQPFIYYQQARAYKLIDDKEAMWEYLVRAVQSGYSAIATLKPNPFWRDVKEDEKFENIHKQADKNARPCSHVEKYMLFDFWLGHWEVYGNIEKKGPLYGTNNIKKAQSGCLITENWLGSGGSTGTSMNYYDGTKNKWVQHWVSAGGTVINIEGGIKNTSMVLAGKIFYINTKDHPIREFRGTWTPIRKGVVRQFFEESIDSGTTWKPWFEGFYFLKPQKAQTADKKEN